MGLTKKERENYDAWIAKFSSSENKKPKTSDDCFTPEPVYQAVKEWVLKRYGIDENDTPIVRPFWPNADYEKLDYPKDCLVLDNPPFSITSKIIQFFEKNGIRFFLFANALTLFSILRKSKKVGFVIPNASIVYENGALVTTAFITSEGENLIETPSDLTDALIQKKGQVKTHNKREYPPNVVSAGLFLKIARAGFEVAIPKGEGEFVSTIEGKEKELFEIFGGGIKLSPKGERIWQEALKKYKDLK